MAVIQRGTYELKARSVVPWSLLPPQTPILKGDQVETEADTAESRRNTKEILFAISSKLPRTKQMSEA